MLWPVHKNEKIQSHFYKLMNGVLLVYIDAFDGPLTLFPEVLQHSTGYCKPCRGTVSRYFESHFTAPLALALHSYFQSSCKAQSRPPQARLSILDD